MIVIKLQGGLGNQLFQFAAYARLYNSGKDVWLDVSDYNLPFNNTNRKYYLEQFDVNIPIKKCIFTDSKKTKLKYLLFNTGVKCYNNSMYNSMYNSNTHDSGLLSDDLHEIKDNYYVLGFFLNERFINSNFFNFFNFSTKIKEAVGNLKLYSEITSSYSISVHIRRTDYINHPDFEGICDSSYYRKAIDYFSQLNDNSQFYFFSDDIDWTKNEFGTSDNYHYINNLDCGDTTLQDLLLMSCCKNNIIANSTFSWWAAFLNRNDEKIVIHPAKYQNNSDIILYSEDWHSIEDL